jgi:hypothetical protein
MATGQLIEGVAEGLEEAAEVTREVATLDKRAFFIGAGIGLAAGVAVGFYAFQRKTKLKYEEISLNEIKKMREHYLSKVVAAEPKPDAETLVKEAGYSGEVIEEEVTVKTDIVIPRTSEVIIEEAIAEANERRMNVKWDWAKELDNRTNNPGVPYVIHYEEWMANEPENDQVHYVYYAEDDVLANEREIPVEPERMDDLICLGNLNRIGEGSPSPDIVHIRNEELGLDMEVIFDRGSYEEHVKLRHIAPEDLQHSSERRKLPRRFDDER